MTTFRRIKIQAVVETQPMLLPELEVERALGELHDKLARLGLTVVSLTPEEPSVAVAGEADDSDPWSIRGQAVD